MSIFRRCAILIILVVFGIALAGCSKTVPVGAVVSETGAAASYGGKVKKGLDLAVEEINAAGGLNGKSLELIYRDDATNQDVGRQVTQELIDQVGVGAIIGAVSSSVTLAIAPICEAEKVILLSPTSSTPDITQAGYYIFRTYPSDILEGTAMANFARDLGIERMAIFAVDNEFGAGLKDVFAGEFESRFRKIVKNVSFVEGEAAGLSAEFEALKEEKPDGIYIVAYVEDVAAIVQQARDAELDAIILTTSSVSDGDLVDLVGTAAENIVFPRASTFEFDSEKPEVRQFVAAYRKKYGEDPDDFAAHGYDAVKVLLEGMQKGKSTHPDNIKVGLLAVSDYDGPSGRVAFDEHGDIIQYPRLFVIRQGRAIPYDRFKEEGGSLPVPGQ
jgi:branched-chain amino acid transport system substrate-binding protein